MHHIRKESKNNYLLWNLAIQIYTTGSYQLPMLSINLFNRDYTCLSMAGQNIKPCMHNAFFFKFGWCMSLLLKTITFVYPLAPLETWGAVEFSETKKTGKNSRNWVTGFYLPNTKDYFTGALSYIAGLNRRSPNSGSLRNFRN